MGNVFPAKQPHCLRARFPRQARAIGTIGGIGPGPYDPYAPLPCAVITCGLGNWLQPPVTRRFLPRQDKATDASTCELPGPGNWIVPPARYGSMTMPFS
jgi:hypothetical protein